MKGGILCGSHKEIDFGGGDGSGLKLRDFGWRTGGGGGFVRIGRGSVGIGGADAVNIEGGRLEVGIDIAGYVGSFGGWNGGDLLPDAAAGEIFAFDSVFRFEIDIEPF